MQTLERTRLLFDLQGFVVIRNVLTKEEVAAANTAIDAHTWHERGAPVRNSKDETKFAGDMKTGRLDMAGMLGWEDPHRRVFRKMLAHPGLVSTLHALVGEGYRLDHSPLVLGQNQGAEGFGLHGGPLTASGRFVPQLQYRCVQGEIYNTLLGVSFQLSDHNAGDGGFCVVRGSHKMNFPITKAMLDGDDADFLETCVEQPVTQAGDVVLFSEATVHGCLPWTPADRQRRVALFRFAPATHAFARGYCSERWPEAFLDGMSEQELAVMQPPFHPMYDRATLSEDAQSTISQGRAQVKKDFDLEVFGTKYY
ncbi:Hypothetical Protein FCC1311_047952 [Hondaea fermentalgiana]|uniref:Phytanoyl-CoA dioxygenase family protein n=1 Tax=Hondaea fermentalgiana TaxID=2315210 RepID=A0A2R5GIU2_9STRA|nr:Hypothetical Protein FCC1311_047952 [Hondaea fermentalgiana]|eukprot:GBG28573.1 Hypothetical Protein FCC1311_047952 [Hondaea fermentalgiana]